MSTTKRPPSPYEFERRRYAGVVPSSPGPSGQMDFPPPIPPPKSTKNAPSTLTLAPPKSGSALWTVPWPCIRLPTSNWELLPFAPISQLPFLDARVSATVAPHKSESEDSRSNQGPMLTPGNPLD